MVAIPHAGISDASMSNLMTSGAATVAGGAVMVAPWPSSPKPSGGGPEEGASVIEMEPPAGVVTKVSTGSSVVVPSGLKPVPSASVVTVPPAAAVPVVLSELQVQLPLHNGPPSHCSGNVIMLSPH